MPVTGLKTCGVTTLPKLYDSDKVSAALEAQGAEIVGRAPWRVEAVYTSLWWGFKDDVVVRLEPKATDVRIARRHGSLDYGLNCSRLVRLQQMLLRNDVGVR